MTEGEGGPGLPLSPTERPRATLLGSAQGVKLSVEYTCLRFKVRDHVAHMTFDSPANNAFASSQEWELLHALESIQTDDDIRVALLTGAGDVFGGGLDRRDDAFDAAGYYERSIKLLDAWLRVDKPIVVAYNGPGSLTLVLASDIVVAERHLEIRDAHVVFGAPVATGTYLWPLSTGLAKAKRLLLTGDGLSAEQAERMGLIAEVVDTGASKARALELATKIAALEPTGVQKSKRALNEWLIQAWGPIFKHALALEFLHFPEALFAGFHPPQSTG